MSTLFVFLASQNGRILRAVAGIVLVLLGLLVIKGTGGLILAAVGLLPLAAALFDFCLFSPLFGGPFWGKDIRK